MSEIYVKHIDMYTDRLPKSLPPLPLFILHPAPPLPLIVDYFFICIFTFGCEDAGNRKAGICHQSGQHSVAIHFMTDSRKRREDLNVDTIFKS